MPRKLDLSDPRKKWAVTRRGLVLYVPNVPVTARFNRAETEELLGPQDWDKLDDHCEIAHIEITTKCNRSCTYCYNPKDKSELGSWELFKVFQNLAKANVFQITFGGGDPFMRGDIFDLAEAARSFGLNVCATTNGDLLGDMCQANPKGAALSIKPFGQINISYHGDSDFFNNNVQAIAPVCHMVGTKVGINFCCQSNYMSQLELVAYEANKWNAELLLLAYKPVRDVPIRGLKQTEIVATAFDLANRYKIDTAVDGACVKRCMASIRFCDVHANGDVSVCSFLRDPIGNLVKEDFGAIWSRRPRSIVCPYFGGVKNDPNGIDLL